jgi:hypothetical protein
LQPLGGVQPPGWGRNLARGDGGNNSVVQQNQAEATADMPGIRPAGQIFMRRSPDAVSTQHGTPAIRSRLCRTIAR